MCQSTLFNCYFIFFHEFKFSNFGNSVEILFALINGDSIWLVFRAFDSHDIAVYVYSRFFVYVFIFLFIYAVLNLFTSLVKTSYDESTVSYISICLHVQVCHVIFRKSTELL